MEKVSLELNLPENQLTFFLDLIERLNFVQVEKINGKKRSKDELFASLRKSLEEVELHQQGKLKLPKIEEVLDEL